MDETVGVDEAPRPVLPLLRRAYLAAVGLTVAGGSLALVLAGETEDWFAWTIAPDLSAAFIGAGFWGTTVALLVASRERDWDRTRLVLPPFTILMLLSLVATFMHHDRFDFESFFGWAWLVAYIAFPAVALVVASEQRRVAGGESPRQPFPPWMTWALAAHATVLVAAALALFLQPEETAELWPWALTPLTGRIVAAWVGGIGVAAALAAWEGCWRRYHPVAAWLAAVAAFQLLALAVYGGDVDWGEPYGWVYLGVVLTLLAVGAAGLAVVHLGVSMGQRAPNTASSSSGTGRSSWS
jgi:peptidoglycan/LPS O-acetylase OafA/YrhL